MSIEIVRKYFASYGMEDRIREFQVSSATVELAAQAVGCIPARIAKTLSFKVGEEPILIVAAGDAKIDNRKYKDQFGKKAVMLSQEEVAEKIGHAVGGVCPFGIPDTVSVYLDISMKRFETVFPAAGSSNSAIELTMEELMQYSHAKEWIDVCKGWQEQEI
ncbi:YbaK/EbsC family protein [bacterium 1XD21-13]|nr:YbaK/EbsC family protein [bacterium 1XD21-13]